MMNLSSLILNVTEISMYRVSKLCERALAFLNSSIYHNTTNFLKFFAALSIINLFSVSNTLSIPLGGYPARSPDEKNLISLH